MKEKTQQEMADFVGISRSHLGNILTGRRKASFHIARRISLVTGEPLQSVVAKFCDSNTRMAFESHAHSSDLVESAVA